jgi:hypothetical protein
MDERSQRVVLQSLHAPDSSNQRSIHIVEESVEGWYTDPYARHEARWLSQGKPTALIRDGEVEGHDPVLDEPFTATPLRVEEDSGPNGGADLRRADDAERENAYDPKRATRRVLDIIDQHSIQ